MQNLKIKKIFIFLTVLPIFLSANGKAQKTVALTFDDGPHPMVTEEIIDILNKYEVPATFFMVGLMVEKHPGIARKVYSGGFEIGNHTYSDTRLTSMSPAEIRSALTSFEEILKRKLGVRSSYFRPPGGRYNQAVLDIAREEGLNVVMWTRLVKDTSKNITAEKIYNLATRNPDEREIILLHDGPSPTLRALPGIIKYYKSHGYKFVPVSSLTPPLFKNIEVASKVSLFKNGAYLSGKVMAGKNLNEDTTHFAGVMVFFVGAGSLLFLFKFKNYKGSPPHDKISLIFLGGDIEKMKLIAETFSKREEKTTFFLTAEELQNLDVGLKQFLLENKHGIAYYEKNIKGPILENINKWLEIAGNLKELLVPLCYSEKGYDLKEINSLKEKQFFPVNWKLEPPAKSMSDPGEIVDYITKKITKSGVVPLYPQNIKSEKDIAGLLSRLEEAGYKVISLNDYIIGKHAA